MPSLFCLIRVLRRFSMTRVFPQLALVLLISSSAWAGFIRGQVKYANGQPADHIVIRLRGDRIAYQTEQTTGPDGRFDFDGLPLSTYELTIEGQGIRSYEKFIDISMSKMDYESITIQLAGESKPKAVPPEGPGARVDARLAAVPDKARKEFDKGRECMEKAQDIESCADHLKKAVKNYPEFADAYVILATAYLQQKNAAEAKDALEHAIQADPKVPEAWFTLGMLQNAQKDFAGAEKSLTEGLNLQNNSPQGHYELGKTYLAIGKLPEAEQQAQIAAKLQPNNAPVHILLGNIAWKKQDAATALREYQEYLKLDPNGPMAPGAQAMVKRIQDWFAQSQTSPQ